MEELSFFDKIIILYDNILDHPFFTLLFFVPLFALFLLKKHGKKIFVILYFLVIFSILLLFGDVIFKLFDNLMDGIFMTLYFPNFVTLFIVVLFTSIFALVSLFSDNMYKVNKFINYFSFVIIQLLFTLILLIVRINEINIYKDNALYTNSDVLSLMQLLIGTFAFQICFTLVINGINKVTNILNRKDSKLSQSISEQALNLQNNKRMIKNIPINNEKIGFINVADKEITSRPKLKPFNFDIKKIESIKIDEKLMKKSRLFNVINLNDKDFSYLNEIIKPRKFKAVALDSSRIQRISLNGKVNERKLFKNVILTNNNFTYLNEIIKPRKFKAVALDSSRIQRISLNGKVNERKLFKNVILTNNNFTYLNEIIKPRKFRAVVLDSNKIQSISLKVKADENKISYVKLKNKAFSYFNEIIKIKKYNYLDLDLNKIQNVRLDVNNDKKSYNKVSLTNKEFMYLNEIVKPRKLKPIVLDSNKIHTIKLSDNAPGFYKKKFTTFLLDTEKMAYIPLSISTSSVYKDNSNKTVDIKPNLFMPMDSISDNNDKPSKFINKEKDFIKVITPKIYRPNRDKDLMKSNSQIICNLNIIDVQSTLDVVAKYCLIKDYKIKGFDNKLTIDKLKICNFKLLIKILKLYKLYKKI